MKKDGSWLGRRYDCVLGVPMMPAVIQLRHRQLQSSLILSYWYHLFYAHISGIPLGFAM
jgi:hypothetical protein